MIDRVFETYRPAEHSKNMPFSVHSAGHYRITPPFVSCDKVISFLQLFWCVQGAGIIQFDKNKCILKKNQIALYYPGMRHYWYADRDNWEFYWFTLDGPLAVSTAAAFGLEPGIYETVSAPVSLFQSLRRFVSQPSKQDELRSCKTIGVKSKFSINLLTSGGRKW